MNTMNISICNACRSIDINGSIRLFDIDFVKSLVSAAFPDAIVSIRRTETEDDEEYVVASITGRAVTTADENSLRTVEARVSKIISDYENGLQGFL